MSEFQQVLIALFFLALVAAVVGSGQGSGFVKAAGDFLVAMVNKVNGAQK